MLINGITVDVEALFSISHSCEPNLCRDDKCCCSTYDVCIDPDELQSITGAMPVAAKYSPNLKVNNHFCNVFQEIEQNLFSIDTDEKEACVFAYSKKKNISCSLHSAATEMGINPKALKPKSCSLWPLSLTEQKPLILSIADDAFSFKCNNLRKGKKSTIDKEIVIIIRNVFGSDFFKALEKTAKVV